MTPIHFRVPSLIFRWPNIWPKMGVPERFDKAIGSIHFIPRIYHYGVSLLTPIHFHVPSLIFGPLVAKYLAENGVSGTFWKKITGSIHFIPGIYPYGVSVLTPILFRVPSLIFGPLVAKYLAENGVSGTFWKNYWLNSFHTWHISLWCEFLDDYTFSFSYPQFRPSGGQIFDRKWAFRNVLKKLLAQFISYLAFIIMGLFSWPIYIFMFLVKFSALWWPNIWPIMGFPELFEKNYWLNSVFLKSSHLCSTRLQNRNLYCIFLDEVGSDQSGGTLSPFIGTACSFWNIVMKEWIRKHIRIIWIQWRMSIVYTQIATTFCGILSAILKKKTKKQNNLIHYIFSFSDSLKISKDMLNMACRKALVDIAEIKKISNNFARSSPVLYILN